MYLLNCSKFMLHQFLLIVMMILLADCKYLVISDITNESTTSSWTDEVLSSQLSLCQNYQSENYIGQDTSVGQIYWKNIYSLPKSSRIYVYLEYQISGDWNNDEIQIFANNIKMFSEKIVLSDTQKLCNNKFLYESYAYFVVNLALDTLTLEIKVATPNLGLYIKNIIISQQQQRGRNEILPFVDFIATCSISGSQFIQYYCKCSNSLVFQSSQCKSSCDSGFLYSPTDNTCYQKQYCSACGGLNQNLVCDPGYYMYTDTISGDNFCISKCPYSHYQDETLKVCTLMTDYLSTNLNGGYPVDHSFFYYDIPSFFHFFEASYLSFDVVSTPEKVNERGFFYRNGQFHVGSWDTFQTQTLIITQNVVSSQHRVKFRAIAHFIDFNPSKINFYINGLQQTAVTLQPDTTNQKDQSLTDYVAYYDFLWVRTEQFPVVQNTFKFEIEQPLQGGNYVGYFYVDELNIFQFECLTGCNACYTYQYCTPCLNPANKNPADCSCVSGYVMKNDVCIVCPTYCTTCVTAGVCVDCKATTLRINSPTCDACPVNYYLKANTDNCQPCITGCKVCSNDTACTQCNTGYFRNNSNVCVVQCPDGQFNDASNVNDPKCTICDNNCLKCQTLATTCTACKGLAILVSGHCYLCTDGQYLSGTTCVSCITNCQSCSTATCSICADSFYYKSSTNQCLGVCDDGYFGNASTKTCDLCNSSCLTCTAGTNKDCLTCPVGKVLNIQNVVSGECQVNCLAGFYKQNDGCAKCWKGCSSCLDGTQACLVCAAKYYRLKADGNCYDKCPDGYYNNSVGYICSPCNTACKTCDGYSELNCLSCSAPLAYYQKQCLTDCYDGYGNINNVCVSCSSNCKSCFGTLPNQCLSCSVGFYYLNNQCYIKCPTFFNGIRPQYVCKCIYDNCVTCTATQFFLNNVCYAVCPVGYYGYNGLCIKCDVTCGGCFGEGVDQCMDCAPGLILYQNTCIPDCLGNLYHDIPSNSCKLCDPVCLACTGPLTNNCTACPDGVLLTEDGQCLDNCPNGQYPVLSEKHCYSCDPSCATCFGQSDKNCLSCPPGQFGYLFQCVGACPDGFSISSNGVNCDPNTVIVIAQCSYQCQTCELTARYCKKCAANRSSNAPNCDCESGYFDDQVHGVCPPCANKCLTCTGVATNCLKCKGDRLLPNCDCPQYYYDDGESVSCVKCQDNCATCNASGCTSCLADRINVPSCDCPDGYYEAFTYYCQQCAQKCVTCSGSALLCTVCSGIRVSPPICGCPSGYFENSDEECQQCDATCKDCNQYGCLSCSGNRVGPINGECKCDTHGISRYSIGQIYCTDCQIGVPYFGLNEDFTGFYFDFGGLVQIAPSVTGDLCTAFFAPSTLAKLGTNPQCDFDFNVLFGENPSLQVGDKIQLRNVFILTECSSVFGGILSLPLEIPSSIDVSTHLPSLKFSQISQLNICAELEIKFDQLFFNGGQPFKIIQWTQILPVAQKPEIQQILQDATTSQKEYLSFPSSIFDSGVLYKISVEVESFAKLQNTLSIQFQGVLQSTIKFEPTSDVDQFHRFESITIPLQISYSNCIEHTPPSQILFYEIKLKNTNTQLQNGTLTEGLIDGYAYHIQQQFEPYFFKFQNPYVLILNTKLTRPDYTAISSNIFSINIVPSNPILAIAGGNRMIGYTEDLYLNSTITDQDLTIEEAANINYICFWSCQDIVNGTACQDQNNETILFDNKCNQFVAGKTFAPYQVFNFELQIEKEQVIYSTKVSIQLIELDLPELTIVGPNQDQVHNYYDEFIYKLEYPNINPDVLMYAGAIIYDQVTQATFQFYYLEFKFRIQNYFTNFDADKGNNGRLRLSIYDPRFIMPSLNTQVLLMNIPPSKCKLTTLTDDSFVEFLDTIIISVDGCQDDNSQLIYSVMLFPNSSIYQSDLEQSNFYNYLLLVPEQTTSHFKFSLPYLNKQDCLLVFNIQDSQEGIVNITKSITVKQFLNISELDFRSYQSTLNSFNDILIGNRLITERLNSIVNLTDYRVELLNQLIDLDQNQSMLSNQTEALYHCISNILSQNVSLISNNETEILTQLNYRIEVAKEKLIYFTDLQRNNKLTSGQNIDKSNYIKQYYTFANILSSYVNYRVAKNVTASEIQAQLDTMMSYLQNISVANEPMYKVQSNSVNMNFGFLTSKMAGEVAGSSVKDDSSETLRLLEAQSDSSTKNYSSSTSFYKFSQTRFVDNPFYASDGFPKNSSGYQAVDPKMINTNSNISTNLSSAMKFQFPINKTLPTNTSTKCVTKVSNGEWKADVCQAQTKNGETVCKCESLNPTSIMESLDFIADKAAQVFSLNTLLAFGSFPFYKTYVFYFYLAITGLYLYIVYWGVKVDNEMFTKIHAEQELLELKKKQAEEKLKELENEEKMSEKEKNDEKQTQKDEDVSIKKLTELNEIHFEKEDEPHALPVLKKSNIFSNNRSYDKILIQNRFVQSPEEMLPAQKDGLHEINIEIQNPNGIQSQLFQNQQSKADLSPDEQQLKRSSDSLEEKHTEHQENPNQNKKSQNSKSQDDKPKGLKDLIVKNSVTRIKAYIEYLKFFHQLLSIVYKSDQKKPRGLRASIVYTSILGSLAVLFVFNQPNNLSFTVALALITAPVNKIYQIALEKTLSHKKKSVRTFGAFFMITCAGVISYVMLAGLVMMDSVETANQWSYIFIGTFSVDNLFYCPIQLVLQYFVHMEFIKLPFFQKLLDKILDEKAKEFLYGLVDNLGGDE